MLAWGARTLRRLRPLPTEGVDHPPRIRSGHTGREVFDFKKDNSAGARRIARRDSMDTIVAQRGSAC